MISTRLAIVVLILGFCVIRQNDAWFSNLPDSMAPAMGFINWRR